MEERIYIAIDLKSFYASVECVERGLDPLTARLVVADAERTEKTICLAVSPALKAYQIPGRARLFQVIQRVKEINAGGKEKIDFITATPRMSLYLEYSCRIYEIYLRFIAPEDIHVYSVDEVLMDVTAYLNTYKMTPYQLASQMVKTVYEETGITATAGIGTNLYLCKVAMDIVAKHARPDENGVRMAFLDEAAYRRLLWNHKPLTDFWRVGRGYATKLEKNGLYTMGDIARCSLGKETDYYNEDLLYRLFGVNAELLIDHAWGYEPCTMADIKAYRPENNSISSGQVLSHPYDYEGARLIVKEMADLLILDLVDRGLMTDQLVLYIGYEAKQGGGYVHGSVSLDTFTSSTRILMEKVMELYNRIVDPAMPVRRINLTAGRVKDENEVREMQQYKQLELTDLLMPEDNANVKVQEEEQLEKEKRIQHAVLDIQKKFGKNAMLKGMNLQEGATTIERNAQIGGHKA